MKRIKKWKLSSSSFSSMTQLSIASPTVITTELSTPCCFITRPTVTAGSLTFTAPLTTHIRPSTGGKKMVRSSSRLTFLTWPSPWLSMPLSSTVLTRKSTIFTAIHPSRSSMSLLTWLLLTRSSTSSIPSLFSYGTFLRSQISPPLAVSLSTKKWFCSLISLRASC